MIRSDRLCVLPAGLSPPSATLRHTSLGSLAGALCVRTMRFLHLTARLPYQGLSPVRLSHYVKEPLQGASLPTPREETRSRYVGFVPPRCLKASALGRATHYCKWLFM